MDYENKSNWTLGENKPNSNPIKPGDGFSSYYKRDCHSLRKRWHYELIGDKIV